MKPILRILPALAIACTAAALGEDPMATTDLAIFKDPAKAKVEIARLLRGAASNPKTRYITNGYHFFPCPQKDGKEIHMLLASYDFEYEGRYVSEDEYPIEDEDELFPPKEGTKIDHSLSAPGLKRVKDRVVLVFDANGRELRPFGGNNLIKPGYVLDAQKDGFLERADSTNYGVEGAKGQHVEVFELSTVEEEPRELLEVIINWHPRSADDANEWTFHCYDEEGDGFVEIAFGPESAVTPEEQRQVVFRWDAGAGKYTTENLPEGSHIRILQPGEELKDLAKKGGLGYPLIEGGEEEEDAPVPDQDPFAPVSLKDASDEAMAAFFQGRKRKDSFRSTPDDPNDPQDTVIPHGFWKMVPKKAALAFADANRTAKHRHRWLLAIDDRGGIQPPAKGWLVHDWGSASCYSYSSDLYALRHDDGNPALIVFGYNSVGVVGRNRWADQPANNARVIPLQEDEAKFLSDTLFWLDRIRSHDHLSSDSTGSGGSYSSADGSATHDRHPEGEMPQRISSTTVWAGGCVAGYWAEEYDREIFSNLANHLMTRGLESWLGDRWEVTDPIIPQNLATPASERLNRSDNDARQQLADTYREVLGIHEKTPLPLRMIAHLAMAAGEERFTEFLPTMERMLAALPPEGTEDEEFKQLQKQMQRDHFGERLEEERDNEERARKRLEELRKERLFMAAPVLREPLTQSVEMLRIADDPAKLMQEVIDEGRHAQWALQTLRHIDPNGWADLITDDFHKGDVNSQRSILSTLSAGHAPAAAKLIAGLSEKERLGLSSEIVEYHQQHEVAKLGDDQVMLLKLIKKPKADYIRRGEAMTRLADIEPSGELLAEFEKLLLKEIEVPQKGDYGMGTGNSAVAALLKLPDAAKHLDFLIARESRGYREYEMMVEALTRLEPDEAKRRKALESVVGRQLENSPGFMNDIFFTCLVHDLRGLEPKLRSMASEGPEFRDGDGANYSGGNFKGPKGQRYHLSREIVALWAQDDERARARMWCYLAACRPSRFDVERSRESNSEQLRLKVEGALEILPNDDRKGMVEAATQSFPVPDYYPGVSQWLDGLSGE